MKEPFPRLEAIYDTNGIFDTRYGFAIIFNHMWDHPNCDHLLHSAGSRIVPASHQAASP